MHTVAAIAYNAVNPFELVVATEVFCFESPELGFPVEQMADRAMMSQCNFARRFCASLGTLPGTKISSSGS